MTSRCDSGSSSPTVFGLFYCILWSCLFPAIFIFFVDPAWPQSNQGMPNDIAKLQRSGQLRVALMEKDIPPFLFVQDGELAGADVDLARNMAKALGVRVHFDRGYASYQDVVDAVAANQADIGIGELTKTPWRSQTAYLSRPYMISGLTLLVNQLSLARAMGGGYRIPDGQAPDLGKLFDNPGATIITMAGSTTNGVMRRLFPHASYSDAESWLACVEAVYAGRRTRQCFPTLPI